MCVCVSLDGVSGSSSSLAPEGGWSVGERWLRASSFSCCHMFLMPSTTYCLMLAPTCSTVSYNSIYTHREGGNERCFTHTTCVYRGGTACGPCGVASGLVYQGAGQTLVAPADTLLDQTDIQHTTHQETAS